MRSTAQIILRSLRQGCAPPTSLGTDQLLPTPSLAACLQGWTQRAVSTSACSHGSGLGGHGRGARQGWVMGQWPRPLLQQSLEPCSTTSTNSSLMQRRTIFGAPKQAVNLQIHTHSKYKVSSPQPQYKWMLGRFVMDRNGVVWHKQANRGSKRHVKSSNALSRLARWKALHPTIAAKFRKLPGVKEAIKYWAPPDPHAVPGFEGDQPYQAPARRNAKVKDDIALRPHGTLRDVYRRR